MVRKPKTPPKGSPAWMTTYGDLVTNLLAFFVLLYGFSEIDAQKFQAVIASFQSHVGVFDGGAAVIGDFQVSPTEAGSSVEMTRRQPEDPVYMALQRFVLENNLADVVEVVETPAGSVLRFSDRVLFDIGKADLLPEARLLLDKFAELATEWPNYLRVEGHTDDWPIRTSQYPSNWELSVYRASTVVRFLEDAGIGSPRLSAVGYGEYRPIASNETVEGRRRNRRVDIIVTAELEPEVLLDEAKGLLEQEGI